MSKRIRMHCNLSGAAIYGDIGAAQYWLARGAEVNHPMYPGLQSPLFQARSRGDMEMSALFREAGADIGPREAAILGETEILRAHLDGGYDMERLIPCWDLPVLAAAVQGGNLETVQLLVERGANVNYSPLSIHRTPLARAAQYGFREIASYFALLAPIGLLEATMLGDVDKVAAFLDAGADPNAPIDGMPPLAAAAMTGQVETARLLLDRGANIFDIVRDDHPKGQPKRPLTGFETALRFGWTEIVLLLLDYGLPIDDLEKTNGLLLAKAMFLPELVRILLARGADPNARNALGSPVLHTLSSWRPVETTQMLLDAGAEVDAADSHGRTALMHAIWCGKREHVRLLLDRGANPRLADDKGVTGLNWVSAWNWRHGVEIQTLLLELGLDVNTQDHEGTTPLMQASRGGCDELVSLYLDHGADRTLRNAKGQSALDLAQNHSEIVALLSA